MPTIRKRGEKWQVQIRRIGQSNISKSFFMKEDAERWARHMEVQADQMAIPENTKLLKRFDLASLVVRYRDTITVLKRSHEVEHIVLNAFLRNPICKKRLLELTSVDFVAYRDERLKKVKPVSVRREFSILHNLFVVARSEWGLPLTTNPLDHVHLPQSHSRRERRLKFGEMEILITAAEACRNPYIIPIIRLAIETGMRRGEILAIRWDHFDPIQSTLLIPHTKNGYSRTIPLNKATLAIFNTVPHIEEKAFPITANAFRLAWQRLKSRTEITDLHFHDLRHEAISRFFEMGLSAPEVALISGHRDMRMLFRYTHPMRKNILAKLQ